LDAAFAPVDLNKGVAVTRNQIGVFAVVPCFNEGAVLRDTVRGLLAEGVQVVVVDDGSERPAAEICGDLPVHLLRHRVNLGQGAALQTGMDYALRAGADYLFHFDGDGQHDPKALGEMLTLLRSGTVDVVLGSRFLKPEHARAVPLAKRVVLRVGIAVSWLFSGLWLSDTHNGLRGFTSAAASRVRLREDGFGHATEILDEIRRTGVRYCEVPVWIRYSRYSQSKGQRLSNGVNILIDLLLRRLIP
jgi:polyprenyl-phospho-N-acetylgalactosaminyl synthase